MGPGTDAEAMLSAALERHQAGDLKAAQGLYRSVLQARPDHPDALHYMGLLAHQVGQDDVAVSMIQQAIAAGGASPVVYSNLGEAYRAIGRLGEAAASYRQALASDPEDAFAHFALANVLYDEGKLEEAITHYRTAAKLAPGDAEAHNNLGNALIDAGEPDAALASYGRAIDADPSYAEAHVNIGNARMGAGEVGAAIESFQAAVAIDPELAGAFVNLGNAYIGQGRDGDALASYERAIEIDPGYAEGLNGRGHVLRQRGEYAAAAESFMAAIDARPEYAVAYNNLARTLIELDRPDDAIATYERAIAIDPAYAEAHSNLGNALSQQGRAAEAVACVERALELDSELAEAHYAMGICLQQQGRFEEAAARHRRALALKPDLAEAHYNLAINSKARLDGEEIARLEEQLGTGNQPPRQFINLNFTLGKSYEDLGEYDRAFACFRKANELKNQEVDFDPEGFEQYVSMVIETFTADFFAERAGCGSESELPVFIVGMPRSGTTLVEQIIAVHPRATGAGELQAVRQLISELPTLLGSPSPYPVCATEIDGTNAAQTAARYLEPLREHSAEADRITDKMPNNFVRLGLIATLMPRARLIHTRRDALDTCLSCYVQNFARGIHFSYDLANLGFYFRQYERIMAHWRTVLPSPILEVPYEDLVADQEGWSRRIIDFCGLEWDPACLSFHEHDRTVRTASFWQVRQPIYSSSVGRWRHYDDHLGPLKEALGMAPDV